MTAEELYCVYINLHEQQEPDLSFCSKIRRYPNSLPNIIAYLDGSKQSAEQLVDKLKLEGYDANIVWYYSLGSNVKIKDSSGPMEY